MSLNIKQRLASYFITVVFLLTVSISMVAFIEIAQHMEDLDSLFLSGIRIGLAALIFLIIGILGSLWVAESFTKPLIKVKEQIQKITWGDLDVQLDIKRKDEIGELAKDFNDMMTTLREYNDAVQNSQAELENKVKARTAELEAAVTELKQLDAMKDNLLSSVSHELRTPLTSIRSYNQLLRQGMLGKVNQKQKEALDVVLNSTDQLIDMVNNILESARFEAGQANFNYHDFNVSKVLKKVLKEFEPKLRKIRAKVTVHCQDNIMACADEQKISEVFVNLINNAIKYRSSRKLALYIIVENLKHHLKVSITDNGIGISKEDLKKMFHKFYQVDQGTTRKVEGTGLGLSIVKHIIGGHGGTISVHSDPDVGTEIIISLPHRKPSARNPWMPDYSNADARLPRVTEKRKLAGRKTRKKLRNKR
ncbi:HAMP domain-containing histidine kinase [Candidatus Woesearchaeota archaeon]|nr:HAMP domain-containing histidine kinase [Candidatus Woesearchaeota archaeon]